MYRILHTPLFWLNFTHFTADKLKIKLGWRIFTSQKFSDQNILGGYVMVRSGCQKKKEGGDMFRRGCMRRERRRDDMVPGALKTQN